MKNRLPAILFSLCLLVAGFAQAQTRYLNEVFDDVNITQDIPFGFNVDALRSNFGDPAAFGSDMQTVTALINNGQTVPSNYFLSNAQLAAPDQTALKLFPMQMDIYTPVGDTETNRPVIVYLHTGNFLPPIINGGISGSRRDSAVVNSCKRWAKSGYTAVALSYRLGWNPISTNADVRRGTLLQAVYRALHDTQTGVRFLRASMAQGNPYGINPDQIVLYGQGSGGYVAQAYNTLNDYANEIAGLSKFISSESGVPYVLEGIDGTIDGGPGAIRLPDPLQVAGIDRSISMSINAGGALADISWLDAGEAPMVAIHCIRDPFAPFDDGIVVVPTTEENVVAVSGGNVFIQAANDFGNNDAFKDIPDGNDPFTDRARSLYGETYDYILSAEPTITVSPTPEGLFPVLVPINTINGNRFTNESGPWDWWDFATLQLVVAGTNAALGLTGSPEAYNADLLNAQGLAGNPGMGPEKGNTYIDTIQGYVNPRIMCVLDLPEAVCSSVSTSNSVAENTTNIFPNPTQHALTIRNNEYTIRNVQVYDITGRMVSNRVVNANEFRFERQGLVDGVYLMQIMFDNAQITKKVLFN
jgi:hypothetical protein